MPEWPTFSTPGSTVGIKTSRPSGEYDEVYEMNTNSSSPRRTSGADVEQTPISKDTFEAEMPAVMRGLGIARHTLGLLLLLLVVVLWTTCNFLGSSIFADNTYAKPFFLTYLNTSTFMLAMIPSVMRSSFDLWRKGLWHDRMDEVKRKYRRGGWRAVTKDPGVGIDPKTSNGVSKDADEEDNEHSDEGEGLLSPSTITERQPTGLLSNPKRTHLALLPTIKLAFFFCLLWFAANYFALACLQFTTVASTTILTSTSSIWTLILGAITRTEKFTWRKLLGVLASLFGIALISKLDMGGSAASPTSDSDSEVTAAALLTRAVSDFPNKPPSELLLGDALALLSAVIYGFYTVMLARTTQSALPLELNMPLFFGFVGTWNFVLLMPLFPLLHYTGIEPFQMPPTSRIWWILILNSVSALASDICWAYAMVLTSPLVVTVGLSLTIPLSLVGEMVIQGRYEGWLYWVGAGVVVGSFVFVDREERVDEGVGGGVRRGGGLEEVLRDEGRVDVGVVVDR